MIFPSRFISALTNLRRNVMRGFSKTMQIFSKKIIHINSMTWRARRKGKLAERTTRVAGKRATPAGWLLKRNAAVRLILIRANLGGCGSMLLVSSSFQDVLDLAQGEIKLFILCIKVRCNSDSGIRPKVDQEVAPEQLGGHCFAMRNIDYNRASALRYFPWAIDLESSFVGEGDQPLGLSDRFFPYFFDADIIDDLVAGLCRVHSRNVRGTVQESEDVVGVLVRAGREGERIAICHPTGDSRFECRPEFALHI